MAAEEDVFLREVDEDLKQDQTIAFFKKNGLYFAGVAGLAIAAVAVMQFMRGAEVKAEARSAERYRAAILASTDAGEGGAESLLSAAPAMQPGYAGLARIRAAALLFADDRNEEALDTLASVYEDGGLPDRLRDAARLRAAYAVLDAEPSRATSLAAAVTTPSMRGLAREVSALAAMAQEDFDTAYDTLTGLAGLEGTGVTPGLASRARELASLVDAGRQGIALEPQVSEAESFIESFSSQLEQELAADAGTAPDDAVDDLSEDTVPEGDNPQ